MASSVFSGELWIPNPIIDGRTTLTEAMQELEQGRRELQQIETILGAMVAGSTFSTLKALLDVKLSPSGIRRGQVFMARGPNPSPSAASSVAGWDNSGNVYVQFGEDGVFSGNNRETITFPNAYLTGAIPSYIIAQYNPLSTASNGLGDVQVYHDTITPADFEFSARHYASGGSGSLASPPSQNYRVLWMAFGGFAA